MPVEGLAEMGARIRTMREGNELTQERLAKLVFVTQPAVSQWERGVKVPNKSTQFRIADVLKCDRSWLFAEVAGRAA